MKNNSLADSISDIMSTMTIQLPKDSLPDPEEVNIWDLDSKRKIFLEDEVDESVLTIIRRIYRYNMEDKGIPVEERKPIWLYILSEGGCGTFMWALIDAIETSKTPIYTVNTGMACSAASLIFVSGKKRYMMEHAIVVIHEGSNEISGDATKVMDASKSYKEFLKQMKEFIVAHTKIQMSVLQKKRANDWEIDAKYCLENGVCDVIVTSLDEIL